MATLEAVRTAMTFSEAGLVILDLVLALVAVLFAIHALRVMAGRRHWARALAAVGSGQLPRSSEPTTSPRVSAPPWSARTLPTGNKCVICDADISRNAHVCSAYCEHVARLWIGDD